MLSRRRDVFRVLARWQRRRLTRFTARFLQTTIRVPGGLAELSTNNAKGGGKMTIIEREKCDRRTALGVMASAACSTLLPRWARADAFAIEPGSWTLVLLPDTQVYARIYPQHYDAQTRWIAEHAESHN